MKTLIIGIFFALTVVNCSGITVTDGEWTAYKASYQKTYSSITDENIARFFYVINRERINAHNRRFTGGLESYRLGINQFSDLKFVDFVMHFPQTGDRTSNGVLYTPPATAPPASFSYSDLGFTSPVQNQGLVCNSGWTYASTTALQIYYSIVGGVNSVPLSAQNFIDCAGLANGCTSQVPQQAFDYLTQFGQRIYPLSEYPNRPSARQGVCAPPADQTNGRVLTAYSTIADGNDDALMAAVNFAAPVVIKYNPGSFEFMHYRDGVFTQPKLTLNAAHFMTVVGYGTDTTRARDYWLVQNSFGTTWGEAGFIRIQRDATKPLAVNAIFPS